MPAADDGARGHAAAWLLPVVATCVALYFRPLFLGRTFVLRDHLIYTWTERKVLADALRAGRIPEWNDLIGFGTEFAASSANGVTYPPLWLTALFPLPFSMDLVVFLHVLFAGVGTALFARRLGANALGAVLAAGAFMACGYVASLSPNKIFVGTAWLPWVAWAADRAAQAGEGKGRIRATALLAAVLAAQLLAGDPASCITSGLVAVLVTCIGEGRRLRGLAWLSAACAGSLLLAAAGVLPGIALLPHTARMALPLREATTWSLHPLRLLEIVWPRVLGDPLDPAYDLAGLLANSGGGELEPGWSLSLYLGAPVVGLAALALPERIRGARMLWAGALALVVLALGAYTPLYPLFRAAFPPERIVRFPEKHVVGAICILCALAGAAFPRPAGSGRSARRVLAAATACIALPLAAATVLRTVLVHRLAGAAALMVPPLELEAIFTQSLRSGLVGLLAAGATSALLLLAGRPRAGRFAGPLAIAVYLVHAGWEASRISPAEPAGRFTRAPALLRTPIEAAPRASPPGRIYRTPFADADILPEARPAYWHETLFLDTPGRFGFAAVPGFEGWRSRQFTALRARAGGMSLDAFLTLYAIDYVVLPSGLRQRLFPRGSGRPQGTVVELELGFAGAGAEGKVGWTLLPTSGVRPRAFVAPRWQWAPLPRALEMLLDPARAADPGSIVLTGQGTAGGAAGTLTPCAVVAYRAERVTLDCDSPEGGYAVLADENVPGWTAAVDGTGVPISSADVLLRAAPVARGKHRVEFRYRTPWLRAGALVSLLAWCGWLGLLRWSRRGRASSDAAGAPGSN